MRCHTLFICYNSDIQEQEDVPPSAAPRRLITMSEIQALGAFPLEVLNTRTRANAGRVEDAVQRLLMKTFTFGAVLNRSVAKGWNVKDVWNASICFITLLPYSGPEEFYPSVEPADNEAAAFKFRPSRGQPGRISHITCGGERLYLNW